MLSRQSLEGIKVAQLQKGTVFADGQVVNAALLNNLVDLAIALEGFISTHAPVTPAGTDYVLLLRPGSPNTLQKGVVSNLPSGVTTLNVIANPASVFGVTNPNPGGPTTTVTLSLDNQSPNLFLAGPVSGAAVAPLFRAIKPSDTATMQTLLANTMDLTLGNVWIKQLSGSAGSIHLHLNNGIAGQRITVYLFQGTAPAQTLVTWDTQDSGPNANVYWPGGVDPVMTHGAVGSQDVYNFLCAGSGIYLGTFNQNFQP